MCLNFTTGVRLADPFLCWIMAIPVTLFSMILKALRIYFSESVRLMLSHRKPSSSNEAPDDGTSNIFFFFRS